MIATHTNSIGTLRIEIKYIEPLIWRRVAVRTSMNMMALHKVIQVTMGWLDYHLWEATRWRPRHGASLRPERY